MRAALRVQAAVFVLLLLVGAMPLARPAFAVCNDVAARGNLNVLTINLMFSNFQTRFETLPHIAALAAAEGVDVILLQEVGAGPVAGTDSAVDLQQILRSEHSLDYEIRTALEAGRPETFAVSNATLSRCTILQEQTVLMPAAFEPTIEGGMAQIPRNALMTLLDVPDFGRVSVYNTHLCAGCTPAERASQVETILGSIAQRQMIQPPDRLTILGGDFALNALSSEDRPDYDRIREEFQDAYATHVAQSLEQLCENPGAPDEHCTIRVSPLSNRVELSSNLALALDFDLPLSLEVSPTEVPSAQRIDYLFVRNPPSTVTARVVFNPSIDPTQPAVSDHGGILARFALPEPPPPTMNNPPNNEPPNNEPPNNGPPNNEPPNSGPPNNEPPNNEPPNNGPPNNEPPNNGPPNNGPPNNGPADPCEDDPEGMQCRLETMRPAVVEACGVENIRTFCSGRVDLENCMPQPGDPPQDGKPGYDQLPAPDCQGALEDLRSG